MVKETIVQNGESFDSIVNPPKRTRKVDTSVTVVRASVSHECAALLESKESDSQQDRNTVIECAIRAFIELPKEARIKALKDTLAARVKSVNDNI